MTISSVFFSISFKVYVGALPIDSMWLAAGVHMQATEKVLQQVKKIRNGARLINLALHFLFSPNFSCRKSILRLTSNEKPLVQMMGISVFKIPYTIQSIIPMIKIISMSRDTFSAFFVFKF